MTDTLEQVVIKYRSHPTEEMGRRIWEECRAMVIDKAKKIVRHAPYRLTMDDLMQDAWLGIERAIVHFDPSRGYKFQTLAARHALGKMKDALRAPRRHNYQQPKYVSSVVDNNGEGEGGLLNEAVDTTLGHPIDDALGIVLIEELTAPLAERDREILRMLYA